MCQSDAECVRQCLNGRPEAFDLLLRRYQIPLVRYLTGRLGHEEAAVEAAQETVVRAYCTLQKLNNSDAFRGWLFGIAARVAKETERQRRRRRQIVWLRSEPADHTRTDGQADPALDQAVAGLPEIYRQVILLRYYGGLSCAEVARELAVPVGTVTMRLSRAYRLLRARLTETD